MHFIPNTTYLSEIEGEIKKICSPFLTTKASFDN
jgi:hypothetical protein